MLLGHVQDLKKKMCFHMLGDICYVGDWRHRLYTFHELFTESIDMQQALFN